jgi:lysyl-tRNA synthetase, class I
MFWSVELADSLVGAGRFVVNDSKTPSGPAHVGALRGVLIHDAMYRTLAARGTPAQYLFGVDDYDPLDELPAGDPEYFRPFLGAPLCNVPAPPGSRAPDMAEHYIQDLFSVFRDLGVAAERYRMRDVYRSGAFDEAIDRILTGSDAVRAIYRDVSGSVRPSDWHPFQTVCEKCGRIGTTEVVAYDGKQVSYRCRPDLVKWAVGCGYRGTVSPFGGNGKLPWKLEWTAKWHVLSVSIEGAGKDHNTRGGSRDVAAACLARLFGKTPPTNIPYEFFLVGGAKMSSSRGVGALAREMADFLPPDVLRFLILRTRPNRPVDFSPEEKFIAKLFNDHDRLQTKYFAGQATADDKLLYELCQVEPTPAPEPWQPANFQVVLALVQMPHLDLHQKIEHERGRPSTELERRRLDERVAAARFWLATFASEEDRIELRPALPDRARSLEVEARAFTRLLASELTEVPWDSQAIQARLFETARRLPLEESAAFRAVYRVFLDRDSGPRAGSLLGFLERSMVLERLRSVPLARAELDQLVERTASSLGSVEQWLNSLAPQAASGTVATGATGAIAFCEVCVSARDGQTRVERVVVGHAAGPAIARRLADDFPFLALADGAGAQPTVIEKIASTLDG